jgi:glycosyltransferase involved in cell wall biosynthesis
MDEKICVSIPVRNCEEFIEQAIISVLSQDYTNLHLNIYDGQSTDNTTKVLQKYEKVKNVSVVYTTNLNSPCRAIKRCLELPDTDIIIPLMADDFFIHNSVVSSFINEFKKNNADFVYGNSYVVDRHNPSKILRKVKNFNFNLGNLKNGNHPQFSGSVAFKKKLIKELNFNDNDFKLACDFDFYIKIFSNSKYKTHYLDDYTSSYRIGGASSKNILKMIHANYEAYESWGKNGIKISKLFLFKKPFSKIKEFLQ